MKNTPGIKFAFHEIIRIFGKWSLIRISFYPLTIIVTTPIRLAKSLWNCRILLPGKEWSEYHHFTIRGALVSLFYATRALNLHRYGRSGYSPYLGLGNYPLSRCFHYSLFSLYAYWKAGAVTLIVGMLGWWIMHFLWFQVYAGIQIIIVVLLAIISTTFYANVFYRQNYNVLGWLFFPAALFGILTQQWILAASAVLLASFGSFTVVILANIIFVVFALEMGELYPIFALIPANIKLLIHFYPFFTQSDRSKILFSVLKAIGTSEKKAKYRRTSSKKLNLYAIYYIIIYIQFIVFLYIITGKLSILLLTGVMIFFINSTFIRFADHHSAHMLVFSLATAVMIINFDYVLIPSYWILISPLPALAFSFRLENFLDVVPEMSPVSLKKLKRSMKDFLSPIKSKQRILMAYSDPEDIYENIFNGYRTIYELILYIAAVRKIHLLPDWWAVFELNYKGAPDFWGRDVASVLKNVKQWQAGYIIIYQKAGSQLEVKWQQNGFEMVAKFSWADFEQEFRNSTLFKGHTPDWWLLKRPDGI